jgi:hypothetical protein
MRQDRMRESQNVEDRRGVGPKAAVGGGLGVIVVIVLALLLNKNPQQILQQVQQQQQQQSGQGGQVARSPAEEKAATFVKRVLGDTEDVWIKRVSRYMRRAKISIIGAGNIGGECARSIAMKELGDVVLLDIPTRTSPSCTCPRARRSTWPAAPRSRSFDSQDHRHVRLRDIKDSATWSSSPPACRASRA